MEADKPLGTKSSPEKPEESPVKHDDDESSLSKVEHEFIETDERGQ